MRPAPFELVRPREPGAALAALTEHEDARILAGGQSLIPMMNLRLARPDVLVDIGALSGLRFLQLGHGGLDIGSLTTHRQVELFPGHMGEYGAIGTAVPLIGHVPIRNRGTIGGSLCHADPSAEWPTLAALWNAQILVQGPSGHSVIAARDFSVGPFSTMLNRDELVLAVRFPRRFTTSGFAEFARRQGDFALGMVAVGLRTTRQRIVAAEASIGAMASAPVVNDTATKVLIGHRISELREGATVLREFTATAQAALREEPGLRQMTAYQARLAGTLAGRALLDAVNRAPGADEANGHV